MRFEILKKWILPSSVYFFPFASKFGQNVTEQCYKNLSTLLKDLVYLKKNPTQNTHKFFSVDVTVIITILEFCLFFSNKCNTYFPMMIS